MFASTHVLSPGIPKWGDFVPLGTLSNVWGRHSWSVCFWPLVSGAQGCCSTPCSVEDPPPPKGTIWTPGRQCQGRVPTWLGLSPFSLTDLVPDSQRVFQTRLPLGTTQENKSIFLDPLSGIVNVDLEGRGPESVFQQAQKYSLGPGVTVLGCSVGLGKSYLFCVSLTLSAKWRWRFSFSSGRFPGKISKDNIQGSVYTQDNLIRTCKATLKWSSWLNSPRATADLYHC